MSHTGRSKEKQGQKEPGASEGPSKGGGARAWVQGQVEMASSQTMGLDQEEASVQGKMGSS